MSKIIVLMVFALTLLFAGCASVIHGTDQTVTITSQPSGAQVLIDGQSFGVTPLTVKLKKNKYETIMVKKRGYTALTNSCTVPSPEDS